MRIMAPAIAGFLVSITIHAQINLPDLIQQGRRAIQQPQQVPGRAPTAQDRRTTQATVSPGQCQALVQWIGILQRENPNTDFLNTALGPKIYDKAVNLFRDEYFQPLYGRSFSQTTPEERLAFQKGVVQPCLTQRQLSPNDLTLLRQYQTIVSRPFVFARTADFSAEYVLAGLAQRQALTAWMRQVIQNLRQIPATPAGFDELESDLTRAKHDLDKLWPREQKAFVETIAESQTGLASEILDSVHLAADKQAPEGLPAVQTISALYASSERFIKILDPAGKEQVQKQKQQALTTALRSAVKGEREKLLSVPATLDGAIALATWRTSFDQKIQGISPPPELQTLFSEAEQQRKRALIASLPEFKKAVTSYPKPLSDGTDANSLMSRLFPNTADAALPEYGQYQSLIAARVATVAKDAAASCDRLAALPGDPEAVTKGVLDAQLNGAAVIAACEPASRLDKAPGRIFFQLARGYIKAGRIEDAIEQLVAAAKQGHGAALAYLGDIHLDGAPGIEADPALAHSLYERSAEAGFAPAKAMLAKFEDYTAKVAEVELAESAAAGGFDAGATPMPRTTLNTKYLHPEIMDNIQKGDLDAVSNGEAYTKIYLFNIADNIAGVCEGQHFTPRQVKELGLEAALKSVDMSPAGGGMALMGGLMDVMKAIQSPEAYIRDSARADFDQEELPEQAMKDAFALMTRHTCGSTELTQFSKNLVAFIHNESAPRVPADDMFRQCQTEAKPTGRYNATNFCVCFLGAVSKMPVSRADRKALSSEFWPTAQKIMTENKRDFAMCTAR